MSRINILSEDVISKISAGEVIERPVSVVKELIENSIDSGADSIQIEIENAGKKKIKVIDNGSGMSKDDACLCIERHATSKIKDIVDLKSILTLGFRGEALASIAAVSNLEIITKEKKTNFGTRIIVNYGKKKTISDTGCSDGTTIAANDLFLNVPARFKFLKSAFTEFGHISEMVFKESLSYPDISFKLIHDGQIFYNVLKEDDLINRVSLYYGKGVEEELIRIEPEFKGNLIKISGIISKPNLSKPNRSYQSVFINKRYVFDRIVANAISSAYDTLMPKDRFPLAVLFIDINPELVDVNVHPTKREVRFTRSNEIHKDVVSGIVETLKKNNIIKEETVSYNLDTIFTPVKDSKSVTYNQLEIEPRISEVKEAISEYLSFKKNLLQVHNTYIIYQSMENLSIEKQGIYVIDQHAAHERIIYEEIISESRERSSFVESQGLLLPVNLVLSTKEASALEENINYFEELGFEIANLGKSTWVIHSVPRILLDKDCANVVRDILSNLTEEKISDKLKQKDKIIKTIACRSASMAGDKLEQEQMEFIVHKIEKCKIPYCPHGRPAVVFLSLSEINKMFKRHSINQNKL